MVSTMRATTVPQSMYQHHISGPFHVNLLQRVHTGKDMKYLHVLTNFIHKIILHE